MGQKDIREMFRREKEHATEKLDNSHEKRFMAKLEKNLPQKRKTDRLWLKIAAVLIVAVSIASFFFSTNTSSVENRITDVPVGEKQQNTDKAHVQEDFRLSEVSPQFKKIEDYYVGSINVELAKLDVTKDNKALIDSFMQELAGLDTEYKRLNNELNKNGLNQQTVEAMITNLQLRLELLLKLKNKLKELKQSKNKNHESVQV